MIEAQEDSRCGRHQGYIGGWGMGGVGRGWFLIT